MKRTKPRAAPLTLERQLVAAGHRRVCGIDEVGRGPLAGPVVAAAVIFSAEDVDRRRAPAVTDSKLLTERERFDLFLAILETAEAVGVCRVEPWDIDRDNILKSAHRAMLGAVGRLGLEPDHLLVDGNASLPCDLPQTTVVKGDRKSRSVAAASVVAKVTRDAIMRDLDPLAPAYGFARNKGYATADHRAAIEARGPSPFHRRSFLGFYQAPTLPFE